MKRFFDTLPDFTPALLISDMPITSGKWMTLRERTVDMTGQIIHWEYIHREAPAVVLPVTRDGELILIDQYRIPLGTSGAWELECPAGFPNPWESFADAAARELIEETGYRVGKIVSMGRYASSGWCTDEIAETFLATDCEYVSGAQDREPSECIQTNLIPIDQVAEFLLLRRAIGQVFNPKMEALVYRFLFDRLANPGKYL